MIRHGCFFPLKMSFNVMIMFYNEMLKIKILTIFLKMWERPPHAFIY